MKARMNIRSIIAVLASIFLASMFLINICFATTTGIIAVESANLREEANTEAEVLESLSQGTEVEIVEESNGWTKVKYNNITGYIRSDLIETSNSTTTNTTSNNTTTDTTTVEDTVSNTIELGKNRLKESAKLKIVPLINSIDLNEVTAGTEVEVTEILNGWAKVSTTDGKDGWVRTSKLESLETTTTETPTTTTTEATTTTMEETTTESTTTTVSETTTTTTEKYFASEDELCNMAIEDHKQKTGTTPAKAETTTNADGTLSIVLTDESGKVLDTYVIDPVTGIGTSSDGSEVNLPQTGNISMKTVAATSAALALTLLGSFVVVKSGVIRKKEDEQ